MKKLISICMILFVMQCASTGNYKSKGREKSYDLQQMQVYFKWIDNEIYEILKEKCVKYKIDIILMCSLIQYESGSYCGNDLEWMKRVRSHAGAIGLCQIMPFHVKNPKTLLNPRINIEKGCWYLSKCIKRAKKLKYKNIVVASARYYNAGVGNKHWKYKNWAYTSRINRLYHKAKTGLQDNRYIAGLQ